MDELNIINNLSKVKNFIGVFSRDELHFKYPYPLSIVVNTEDSSHPGSHWVAIYIDENGYGEYFDSYGFPPMHQEFIWFLENNSTKSHFYNKKFLQCLTCITCGHYCIAYIKMRSNGNTYFDFIKLFTNNQLINDKIIKKFVKHI